MRRTSLASIFPIGETGGVRSPPRNLLIPPPNFYLPPPFPPPPKVLHNNFLSCYSPIKTLFLAVSIAPVSTSFSWYTQAMPILILINVHCSKNVVFSFEKGLYGENLSSSGSHHLIKNPSQQNFTSSNHPTPPLRKGGNFPPPLNAILKTCSQ